MLMHMLSNRGSAHRLPLPVTPRQDATDADPAIHAASPGGLSREELRKIVLDLIG
jgi:hypothetical protein